MLNLVLLPTIPVLDARYQSKTIHWEANNAMNESLPVERSLVRRPREGKGRGTLMQGNISLLVAFKKNGHEVAPMRNHLKSFSSTSADCRREGRRREWSPSRVLWIEKKSLPWTISLSLDWNFPIFFLLECRQGGPPPIWGRCPEETCPNLSPPLKAAGSSNCEIVKSFFSTLKYRSTAWTFQVIHLDWGRMMVGLSWTPKTFTFYFCCLNNVHPNQMQKTVTIIIPSCLGHLKEQTWPKY